MSGQPINTYQATITRSFDASHALRLHDGKLEPVHAHTWRVLVTVGADKLDEIDTVMDFHELEQQTDALITPLNHTTLNDHPPFSNTDINPSAERVAWWIAHELDGRLPKGVRLVAVQVGEAPGCLATYRPCNTQTR